MNRSILTVLVVLLAAPGLRAQEGDTSEPKQDKAADRDEILAALELPKKAQALRNKGVEKAEVREALRAARGKKLKARQARDLLEGAEEAVDESGPIDNFGAFVKARLAEGLRGRELAAAIRAEHQARGKGKGKKGEPKGQGPDKEKGPKKAKPKAGPAEDDETAEVEEESPGGRGSGQGQGQRGRGRSGR